MIKMEYKNDKYKDKTPYNYCDYRCDCCDKRDICVVYQKEMERSIKHIMNGEDPADMNIIFNDLKEDFSNISENIEHEMIKHGIPLETGNDSDSSLDEEEEFEDAYIREHPLYESVQKLYDETQHFLSSFYKKPVQGDPLNGFFEDLLWHHTLILVKVYRLLSDSSLWEDDQLDGIVYEESMMTLEVIKKSVSIMKSALEKIGENKEGIFADIEHLKVDINDIEAEINNMNFEEPTKE